MPFFVTTEKRKRKVRGNKRQNISQNSKLSKKIKGKKNYDSVARNTEIESSSEEEELQQIKKWKDNNNEILPFEDKETVQEKKERLARQILEELAEQKREEESDEEASVSILRQLKEKVLESRGKLFRKIAHSYSGGINSDDIKILNCRTARKKPLTCVVVSPKDGSVFASSLDGKIFKWDKQHNRVSTVGSSGISSQSGSASHMPGVLALSITSDGKFLASGDEQGVVHAWNADSMQHLEALKRHTKSVTGLAFQKNSLNLFSCGRDRKVLQWSFDTMAYVDFLGGHSTEVLAIDSLHSESCISVAGMDETVIIYSVVDDRQFQYQGRQLSIDCVKLINERLFVSGGQDGSLCLWSTSRKRPLQQLRAVHGLRNERNPHWITAITVMENSDLVASGSSDGYVRLWRVDSAEGNKLHAVARIEIPLGTVNSLAFSPDGRLLYVAIAPHHRLGRWDVIKNAKNSLLVITLKSVAKDNHDANSSTAEEHEVMLEDNDSRKKGDFEQEEVRGERCQQDEEYATSDQEEDETSDQEEDETSDQEEDETSDQEEDETSDQEEDESVPNEDEDDDYNDSDNDEVADEQG